MGNLSEEELKEARARGGRFSGNSTYNKGRGIFALPEEERNAARKRGAKKGGPASLAKKTGIHRLTKKELSEAGLAGGRAVTLKRGQVPWVKRQKHDDRCDLAEVEFAYNLTFIYGTDYDRIANELNLLHHEGNDIRDYVSVKSALWRFRKGLIKNL